MIDLKLKDYEEKKQDYETKMDKYEADRKMIDLKLKDYEEKKQDYETKIEEYEAEKIRFLNDTVKEVSLAEFSNLKERFLSVSHEKEDYKLDNQRLIKEIETLRRQNVVFSSLKERIQSDDVESALNEYIEDLYQREQNLIDRLKKEKELEKKLEAREKELLVKVNKIRNKEAKLFDVMKSLRKKEDELFEVQLNFKRLKERYAAHLLYRKE